MSQSVIAHVDGAARGNPGPAAVAYTLAIPGKSPLEKAETIGTATNNVAEYRALIFMLKGAKEAGVKRLDVRSDSELMVKQINGEYRVKNADLKPLFDEAKDLIAHFDDFEIQHIRREQNKRTDELCNEALDGGKPKSSSGSGSTKTGKVIGEVRAVSDARVRDDCIECLQSAAAAWKRGEPVPNVEMVWDQLWSILEEARVLKT